MECARCRDSLDAYLDGELAPAEADAVRGHVAACSECARIHATTAAASRLLREGLVRYQAPDVLKARIRSAVGRADAAERPVRRVARWGRLLAAGVVIAALSSAATVAVVRQSGGYAPSFLAREVLASHVRSLMPGHLTDVASTNQHNVKPWFNGRVNLSPPVPALDSAGFPLVGGRLDYLADRAVAAIVYSRRQHIINVYAWPEDGSDRQISGSSAQGYHLFHWRNENVAYWVVSDLNPAELSQFVGLFQGAGRTPSR